jgi:acyl-CoA thioester hydrolase
LAATLGRPREPCQRPGFPRLLTFARFAASSGSAKVAARMSPPDTLSPAAIPAPFVTEGLRVEQAWIDVNGHMNVAWYLHVFDLSLDDAFAHLGLDLETMIRGGRSIFTVEIHLTYQQELNLGDPLRVTSQFLGFDAKRLRFFQRLYHAEAGFQAASCEWLFVYIDMGVRRVTEMPPGMRETLARLQEAHARLPVPAEAGRGIVLGSRRPG